MALGVHPGLTFASNLSQTLHRDHLHSNRMKGQPRDARKRFPVTPSIPCHTFIGGRSLNRGNRPWYFAPCGLPRSTAGILLGELR